MAASWLVRLLLRRFNASLTRSVEGSIAAACGVTPFVLLKYGPKIRARSRFAKEMARLQA